MKPNGKGYLKAVGFINPACLLISDGKPGK